MKTLNSNNVTASQSMTPWVVDLVRIVLDSTAAAEGGDSDMVIRLTNHYHDLEVSELDPQPLAADVANPNTVSGTYVAAGEFLGFGSVSDDLEIKGNSLDLSLSGVDYTFVEKFLDNTVEGSLVEVKRGFYDESTGALVAPPELRWSGRVNNSSIQDDYNYVDQDKVTISVSCKSLFETIFKKQSGRNTSLNGFQSINAGDLSMEFVASIANFSPSFGKEDA